MLVGMGFTTRRLAKRLEARGAPFHGVGRDFHAGLVPKEAVAVLSIPPLEGLEGERLHEFIREMAPRRVVYISATSVYGEEENVDETTVPRPAGEKSVARFEEEQWLLSNRWSNLIVRPAAIYGPGRGVHEKIREGKLPRSAGSGVVSRIHVDDLVAVLDAAIGSDLEGAWPLADEHPCPSEEVAEFCVRSFGWEPVRSVINTAQHGRRVDGRKIRELLGVRLKYPSYETGIPASVAEPH